MPNSLDWRGVRSIHDKHEPSRDYAPPLTNLKKKILITSHVKSY